MDSISQVIHDCETCAAIKQAKRVKPLWYGGRWSKYKYGEAWQIDYITLPQTHQGQHYVLTMVEATTGWLETYPVPHTTAWNTILGLEKQILWRHGTPERIESDNGTHFKNSLINTWAREHSIEWIDHIHSCTLRIIKPLPFVVAAPATRPAQLKQQRASEQLSWVPGFGQLPTVIKIQHPSQPKAAPSSRATARELGTPCPSQALENLSHNREFPRSPKSGEPTELNSSGGGQKSSENPDWIPGKNWNGFTRLEQKPGLDSWQKLEWIHPVGAKTRTGFLAKTGMDSPGWSENPDWIPGKNWNGFTRLERKPGLDSWQKLEWIHPIRKPGLDSWQKLEWIRLERNPDWIPGKNWNGFTRLERKPGLDSWQKLEWSRLVGFP
ncbi:hypothetical protein DUI87_09937 [Hirundo rustica rustica]|uniref:Integrase catalytic domain-containing protein n=1 Tax=Hirundo rustica rustica TaxID=333673 RepID=A0A3M0KGU5_HIRRU|nr:hypothetical protein DUI87_09937 [Hirundo rustica rustica]